MKKTLFVIFGIALGGFFLAACREKIQSAAALSDVPGRPPAAAVKYHCPMHPAYVSDKPGDCPICGMKLVPMESEGEKKPLYYRNPMRADVTSLVPMKDAMGMDYVPVFADESAASPVPGRAAVSVSADREQLIGVRTGPVSLRPLHHAIRASARVAYDPDLYNALADYREALRGGGEALVRATRLRLRQFGLSDPQIVVAAKGDPSNLLAEDSGTVWVYAQIYADEASLVKAGQRAEITSSSLAGRTLTGRVAAVDRIVDAETRTLKARIEVPNTENLLRPEMFVEALIHVDLGTRLAVPEEAVIRTGERDIVFVRSAPGRHEPREIRIGREAEDFYEVLSGVSDGEEVVTSANFLIDSESRLKAAARGRP